MMRKLIFTALATAMTSVAAAVAYKAAERLWRAMTDEEPPRSRLTDWIAHGLVRGRVLDLMEAGDVLS